MPNDLDKALAHHQAGRFEEAEALYREILTREPEHADVLHMLGIVALQTGRLDVAIDQIGRAIARNRDVADYHYNLGLALAARGQAARSAEAFKNATALKPDFAEAHNNLGNVLKEQGQLEEAYECYQRALALCPDYAAAHTNLGVILQDRGDTQGAIEHYQNGVAIDPDDADGQFNLANVLRATGRLNEAVSTYQKAIELRPDFLDAYVNLGMTLKDSNALDSAIDAYERALAIDPRSTDVWLQLGNALKHQGKVNDAINHYKKAIAVDPGCAEAYYNLGNAAREVGDVAQAVDALKRATTLKSDFTEAYTNLGDTLCEMGQLDDGLIALQQALALSPDSAEAHNNLGNVLRAQGRLGEAVAAYREALALKRKFPQAYNNLGIALQDQGQLDQAPNAYRQALALDPHFAEAHSNLLLCLNYRAESDAEQIFAEHQQWGTQQGLSWDGAIKPHDNGRDPGRCLHIGYVSPDFRAHSVAHFITPVLRQHERDRYEVYCYHNARQADATTERLRHYADHWRDIVHLADDQAAGLIRKDGIDILVDLAGHTAHNRLLTFARKPAPVQVNYLGYPNTTGLTAIDYRLTDAWADPPGHTERYHSEMLMRLPNGFCCYQPPDDAPPVSSLPARANGYVTLASLNNVSKITAPVAALWARILRRLPGSRLLLQAAGLADGDTRNHVCALFTREGVTKEQLVMLPSMPFSEHLALYSEIDIALDPFPWNGHTTTCHALWMGVPVIVLQGARHAARMGVSILSTLDLPDLIATSPEAYVELVTGFANDLERLEELRQDLRDRMKRSPLTDAEGFTRALEKAYREMWIRYCESGDK